jgi:hypothetical protein
MYFQLYVEDYLGDGVWVDHEDCEQYPDCYQPRSLPQPDLVGMNWIKSPSPSTVVMDEGSARKDKNI